MANDFSGDENCVALYRFESGALTTDSGPETWGNGTNTLTSAGTPAESTADPKEGSCCVDFESADAADSLYCLDTNLTAGFPCKSGTTNKTFSICFWTKLESITGYNAICRKDDTSNTSFRIYSKPYSYWAIAFGYSSGTLIEEIVMDAIALPSAGTWYHVGVVIDDTDQSYYFRVWNGSSTQSDSGNYTNAISADAGAWVIGSGFSSGAPVSSWMDGLIDELVVFKDKLTTDQIDAIRQGTYVVSTEAITADKWHPNLQQPYVPQWEVVAY